MTLEQEIAEAQSFSVDPPKNESNTCDWIIMPLLLAAGYARRDIESRVADSTGQFPDYTLVPNALSATWYLEAKSWNVALEDVHVKQALNYANHNGKRFVVLTNGQIWRFYDNSIQGLLADKLIAQAALQDTPAITDLLNALTKAQVLSGGLERYAAQTSERRQRQARQDQERRQRDEEAQRIQQQQAELRTLLHSKLPDQLCDPDGELVRLMMQCLHAKEDFKELAPQTLAMWFNEILSDPPHIEEDTPRYPSAAHMVHASRLEQQGEHTLTLKAIQGIPINGKNSRPVAIHTPDGEQVPVRTWVDLAEQIVRWLLQQSRPLPIPFECSSPSRWFLNSTPKHKREDQRKKFKTISIKDKTVYMDADRSGTMFVQDVHALCLATQVPPEGFRITLIG